MSDSNLGIAGLEWENIPRIDNGHGSFVHPLPTTQLVHVVFHGEKPFSHGQFGVHLGLEDRLTFLGPQGQTGHGHFVDCRSGSPTLHERVDLEIRPDAGRRLLVPCGVGHCFDGLEGVFTLNSFNAFLPPPDLLLTDKSPWATGADIFNFPIDCPTSDLPTFNTNPFPASDRFYELLSAMQAETLGSVEHEYPVTEQISFADGTESTVMVRKALTAGQKVLDWEGIGGIDGLGWRKHLVVWSGDEAGYVALTDPAPLQVIDHGTQPYSTDAFGIHLQWEDRLTFVGPLCQEAVIHFVDCRRDSSTCHQEISYRFTPSALRFLVIPPGVGHAFEGLERIFTINRPRRCAGPEDNFSPGNDVIDWPLSRRPWPSFDISQREFPYAYYRALAKMQRDYLATPNQQVSTASVLLIDDGHGEAVRVAIRSAQPS